MNKKQLSIPLLAVSVILIAAGNALAQKDQLGAQIEEVTLTEGERYDEVVYVQRSRMDRLTLEANACYFFPVGPLLTGGERSESEEAKLFNKGETYSGIGGIEKIGQQIKWAVLPVAEGSFELRAFMTVSEEEAGAEWIVRFGGLEERWVSFPSDGSRPQPWVLKGSLPKKALDRDALRFATIELAGKRSASSGTGEIRKLELEGPGISGAYVVRSRWRPMAVHTRFSSSSHLDSGLGIKAWVVEVKPEFDFAGDPFQFYAPVTTEFGYYGSVFTPVSSDTPELFTAKPMNFSLWSYRRNSPEPPIGQLSHLLALGDPNRLFGGFHHEGTGVKPRGALPEIEGKVMGSLILGMRFDAADPESPYPYRTYHSYFADPESGEWRLYASGRKFTDHPGQYGGLREPGSFVEVPGPVRSQRTHQSIRAARYRGWIMDTDGTWHSIDRMEGRTKPGELVPKEWGVLEDGWFRMATGGMIYRRYKGSDNDASLAEPSRLPAYMSPEALKGFYAHPVSVEVLEAKRLKNGKLRVVFDLKGNAEPAEVVAHYGTRDGLTLIFEDGDQSSKWEGSASKRFAAGSNVWEFPLPRDVDQGYCRLLVNAKEGRYWALESAGWESE